MFLYLAWNILNWSECPSMRVIYTFASIYWPILLLNNDGIALCRWHDDLLLNAGQDSLRPRGSSSDIIVDVYNDKTARRTKEWLLKAWKLTLLLLIHSICSNQLHLVIVVVFFSLISLLSLLIISVAASPGSCRSASHSACHASNTTKR